MGVTSLGSVIFFMDVEENLKSRPTEKRFAISLSIIYLAPIAIDCDGPNP